MKTSILLVFFAYLQASSAFMKATEFFESGLEKCYDPNLRDSRRLSLVTIHGQDLPLPNSIETFIGLIERYESIKTNIQPGELVRKLLQSFRIDNLNPDLEERKLKYPSANQQNDIKRAFFGIPTSIRYDFETDDFTDDEKCALHFMLSHTINDTRQDDEPAEFDDSKSKHPLETGVVSLYAKWNHAFALGRVLLGIGAGYMGTKDVETNTILQKMRSISHSMLTNVRVNPVYTVTFGDLMVSLIGNDNPKMLPNGMWNDISCPTDYRLDDNNKGYVSYSELRGAIDGLIIGKKIQENPEAFKDYRLSQILRMYYGYSEMPDNERTRWCYRDRIFSGLSDFEEQMLNFNTLAKLINDEAPGEKARNRITMVVQEIRNNVFRDIDTSECSITETSPDRKLSTPTNIFAIMDYSATTKLSFQQELIGNLSKDFDVRPHGNLFGVYTNLKPIQQHSLDTIVKNTGIPGCPSCFAKYYARSASKEEEAEVLKDLNYTLTAFEEEYDELRARYQEATKSGSPGKVLLYFNYGNPSEEYRLREAKRELREHFRGLTILAVGDSKEKLSFFVEDDETDIFTGSTNAEAMAKRIKQRLSKVPGEFLFKKCNQSTTSTEAENRQEVYITPGKTQYWAMYPQYFLKSFGIKMKFKAQDGTQIRVCFSRYFSVISENNRDANCKDSSGEEIEFHESNPCKKRDVYNCNPFYFSVEGKKTPTQFCTSMKCNTLRDIQFEFEHQGISCNIASYASVSYLGLLLTAILLYMQRH